MAHFMKHWPLDLVEEVESVVHEQVSQLIICLFFYILLTVLVCLGVIKFVERYNERIDKEQPPATRVHKAAASHPKIGHQNIDDTDSSDDNNNCQQASKTLNTYIEEWNLYLNTHEAMSDDIRIVHWWGMHLSFLFPELELTLGFYSCMVAITHI
jgi:hypothetical protein